MATPEITTHPTATQGRIARLKSAQHEKRCNHCRRPIAKSLTADRKPYCGRLCAALGLIATVDRISEFNDNCGISAVLQLVEGALYEGPRLIPVTVRDRDAEDARGCETFPDGGEGTRTILVCIDDAGTPDWAPDPILDAQQEDIDYAVDTLLLPRSPLSGEGVTL